MNVTFVPLHIVVAVGVIETAVETLGFTVIVIELLVAASGEAQEKLDVMTTETIWPFVKEELVYVGELNPTFVAPTFHW